MRLSLPVRAPASVMLVTGVVALAALVAGCGSDNPTATPVAPSATSASAPASGSSSGSASGSSSGGTDASLPFPDVAPAGGRRYDLSALSLTAPTGWRTTQQTDDLMGVKAPGVLPVFVEVTLVPSAQVPSDRSLIRQMVSFSGWARTPPRVDDVTVDGARFVHLQGATDTNLTTDMLVGGTHGYIVIIEGHGVTRRTDAIRENLMALANTVTFTGQD